MRARSLFIMFVLCTLAPVARPQAPNFEEHILPAFDLWCIDCHRGGRAKNGLKLSSFDATLDGGSGGPAIVPGDASSSLLYQLVAREREPFMPYEDEPFPDELVTLVRDWINAGAPKDASSPTAEPKAAEVVRAIPLPGGAGAGAMPRDLRTEPYWWTDRGTVVSAVAASPTAPLLAVAGHRQIVLYNTDTLDLLGVLDFPEGEAHSLAFSRSGAVLIAGGGIGSSSGRVVGWDVASGERVLALGDEPDVVLAADITSDHQLVALAGPDRVVRVFATETGEQVFELDKHTDWVTALAFSPDDVLLATGDRVGAVYVWESFSGRLFHTLPAHKGRVTGLAWRADANVLASASEDAAVRLCEMENGSQIRTWSTHGGVLGITWGPDGRIATVGRDGLARFWDGAGAEQAKLGPFGGLATAIGVSHDGARVFVGDFAGDVRVLDVRSGDEHGKLAPNPRTDLQRALTKAESKTAGLKAQLETKSTELSAARSELAAANEVSETTLGLSGAAEQRVAESQALLEAARAAANAALAEAAPLRSGQTEREALFGKATERVATARSTFEAARAELMAAQDAVLETELLLLGAMGTEREAQIRADLELRSQLAAGALAIAQRAAAGLAEEEVELERRRLAQEKWSQAAAPKIAAAAEAGAALQQAETRAQEAQAEAETLARRVSEIRSRVADARAAVASAQTAADDAAAALDELTARIASLRRAWDSQRQEIRAASGRVPPVEAGESHAESGHDP